MGYGSGCGDARRGRASAQRAIPRSGFTMHVTVRTTRRAVRRQQGPGSGREAALRHPVLPGAGPRRSRCAPGPSPACGPWTVPLHCNASCPSLLASDSVSERLPVGLLRVRACAIRADDGAHGTLSGRRSRLSTKTPRMHAHFSARHVRAPRGPAARRAPPASAASELPRWRKQSRAARATPRPRRGGWRGRDAMPGASSPRHAAGPRGAPPAARASVPLPTTEAESRSATTRPAVPAARHPGRGRRRDPRRAARRGDAPAPAGDAPAHPGAPRPWRGRWHRTY